MLVPKFGYLHFNDMNGIKFSKNGSLTHSCITHQQKIYNECMYGVVINLFVSIHEECVQVIFFFLSIF